MVVSVSTMVRGRGFRRRPAAPGGLRSCGRFRFDWRREIHPVLVNYPAALLVLACLLDLASRASDEDRRGSRGRVWLYQVATGTACVLFTV